MPKNLIIGDTHCKYQEYFSKIQSHQDHSSIQVGDFGIGLDEETTAFHEQLAFNMKAQSAYFIRGNHDNPSMCKAHAQWIPDGTMHNGVFCMGGALSSDRNLRYLGVDLFEDEECSLPELYAIIESYEAEKPRVVVSHDAPETIAALLKSDRKPLEPCRTRSAYDTMLEIHQPEVWIFGHWHQSFEQTVGSTTFVCLDELETRVI